MITLPPGARLSEIYVANIKDSCIHGRAYVFDRNVFQEIPSAIGDGRNAVLDGLVGDAYDHFAEGESPDPPFLIFLFPYSDNFVADGAVYQKIDALHFELYTDKKDSETERAVEAVLDGHGIFYDKTEVWIESERLYEVIYSMEVLNG